MESWQQFYYLQENEYLKLNFSLYKCTHNSDGYSTGNQATQKSDNDLDNEYSATSSAKPPLLQNVLGDSIFQSFQSFFSTGSTENNIKTDQEIVNEIQDCDLVRSVGLTFTPLNATIYLLTVVIATLILVVLFCKIPRWFVRRRYKKVEESKEVKVIAETKMSEEPKLEQTQSDNESLVSTEENPKSSKDGLHLSYQCQVLKEKPNQDTSFSVTTFLEQTINRLFKKLDKLLLKGLADGQSLAQTCPATPRLVQRNPVRRQRMGSSPALQSLPSTSSMEGQRVNEDEERAWGSFITFCEKLHWKYPYSCKLQSRDFDHHTLKLLYYFDRVCQIPRNMWETSSLVTNYVLHLISLEMEKITSKTGYRFIEFLTAGSADIGTKIAKPNQFDILMVLQPPVMPESVFDSSCDNIPPGMVMITLNTLKLSSIDKKVAFNAEIQEKYRLCLSAKEFAMSAESLVEDCLKSLYTRSRSVMDRLPFQIKGAPSGTLMLNINTRALVGFGETDIRIRIIPVLPLPAKGWYHVPMLYATPTLGDFEYKQRAEPWGSAHIHPDLLWQIDTSEYENVFSAGVESMMKHANVNSCHIVCLMILKGLFTAGGKNNLLDRGVFQSYHLSTVVNFLLLESAPSQWTYDKLGDRFSDAIHFLKAAFGCSILPHFFVNNPHLISKMPAVAENQILIQKRQKNLLLDMTRESLEKNLEYLDLCLRDAGLADCVKEEFSSDMWEFEFFLFN